LRDWSSVLSGVRKLTPPEEWPSPGFLPEGSQFSGRGEAPRKFACKHASTPFNIVADSPRVVTTEE
jgi:hypothetical protein